MPFYPIAFQQNVHFPPCAARFARGTLKLLEGAINAVERKKLSRKGGMRPRA
jgi:hypothetical protein